MNRYVTDDLKIMTKKAIADVMDEDEDRFLRNLKYVLEHLKPIDIEIYAKFLFSKLVCVKENAENVTQTDLRNIEDIQYPSRHDKTAYELKIENNKLQAEINRLRTALENLIEAFLILKRFYPTTTLFADEHIKNINKALNGESEVKC